MGIPTLGNSAYRSKLVGHYTDCSRNTTRTTRKDTPSRGVPGRSQRARSPQRAPAPTRACGTRTEWAWQAVPRCCVPASSMGLDYIRSAHAVAAGSGQLAPIGDWLARFALSFWVLGSEWGLGAGASLSLSLWGLGLGLGGNGFCRGAGSGNPKCL